MAAPSATARTAPTGRMLENGHSTKITLAADPDIDFEEIEVTPPGFDGGDAIPTTTMFNVSRRTKAPGALVEVTDGAASVAYDPGVYTAIRQMVNRRTTITVRFPDGTTWAEYGYLKSFTPTGLSEGNRPTADVVFVFTSVDPSNGDESEGTLTNVTGT